jgi:DNA-binding protein H-NS
MAKTSGITKGQLRSWFAQLPFTEQKSVLIDLTNAHNEAKSNEIQALRSKLALLESGETPATRNGHRKVRETAKRRGPMAGVKVAPKYQDRKSNLTWTGRGLQPIWVREFVKKGGKLDDLLIKKTRKAA